MLKLPVVSLLSAPAPTAVFPAKSGGAIQCCSAPEPMAVWQAPVVLQKGERSNGRVVVGGVVFKGSQSNGCVVGPVVFNKSAAMPTAVLLLPSVLRSRAAVPTAVFWEPVVLEASACQPNAAFAKPVVRLKRALCPSAVLRLG